VMPLRLPALRERPGDIAPIAQRLLARLGDAGPRTLSPAALERLLAYRWPGNVRELENVLQRAVLLAPHSEIGPDDLSFSDETQPGAPAPCAGPAPSPPAAATTDEPLRADLKDHERGLIFEALRQSAGSRKDAAQRLGISPRTLRHKLAQLRARGVEIPGSAA